jgi:hypothetical protein
MNEEARTRRSRFCLSNCGNKSERKMQRILVLLLLTCSLSAFAYGQKADRHVGPHIPAKTNPERQAILNALRSDPETMFKVHYIKVHGDWCWIDTTPMDKQGRATAEGGPNLLHLENGSWKVMDLSKVPPDPKDPLGAEDASRGFVTNLIKTFPDVPRDIFPKPSK